MANYQVIATNRSGKSVKVFIDSDSLRGARQKARTQGLIPIEVKVTSSAEAAKEDTSVKGQFTSSFKKVSQADLSSMTRQLATLVKSHVPILESLSALIDQIDSKKLRPILMNIRQQVQEGKSLGDGFALYPAVFNRVYVNMVRAGESSGRLDVVLLRLAEFSEAQVRLKNRVMGAMTYPIIMMVIGTGILALMFAFVVPRITSIFENQGEELPFLTRAMIAVSEYVQNYGMITAIGVLVVAIVIEKRIKTEKGRAQKDRFVLKLPILKGLVRSIVVARFARTLGTLLNSGVPMLSALEITKNVTNSVPYEEAVDYVREQVSEGRGVARSLKQTGIFPPIVTHMVGVGEKSGELEEMLLNVAESYEEQVDSQLGKLTSLLEPVMIVAMAIAVGGVVLAVLQPIFKMNQFSGG